MSLLRKLSTSFETTNCLYIWKSFDSPIFNKLILWYLWKTYLHTCYLGHFQKPGSLSNQGLPYYKKYFYGLLIQKSETKIKIKKYVNILFFFCNTNCSICNYQFSFDVSKEIMPMFPQRIRRSEAIIMYKIISNSGYGGNNCF